jgi:hypothetical protein
VSRCSMPIAPSLKRPSRQIGGVALSQDPQQHQTNRSIAAFCLHRRVFDVALARVGERLVGRLMQNRVASCWVLAWSRQGSPSTGRPHNIVICPLGAGPVGLWSMSQPSRPCRGELLIEPIRRTNLRGNSGWSGGREPLSAANDQHDAGADRQRGRCYDGSRGP